MHCTPCIARTSWDLPFLAEPEEVAALRRILRTHLGLWGMCESIEAAQLCVSELVANVIKHVGPGTPTTLAISMNGTHLRIEVHDPDTRSLPTLIDAGSECEGGRGMALVDAIADRWGILLRPDRKITWCELATGLASPHGHMQGPGVLRAEALLSLYTAARLPREVSESRVSLKMAEESVIDVITDFLQWLRVHGCDIEQILDKAQTRFEAQIGENGGGLPCQILE